MGKTINVAAKHGLVIGLVQILITLLLYLLGTEVMAKFWVSILVFIVTLVLLIISTLRWRRERGGIAIFKDAFVFIFFNFLTLTLISTVFNILLYNLIDPGLPLELKESVIDSTMGVMESFGAPEDAVDQAIADLDKEFAGKFSVSSLSLQYLYSLIFGAFISLILGAILKKKPDSIEEA